MAADATSVVDYKRYGLEYRAESQLPPFDFDGLRNDFFDLERRLLVSLCLSGGSTK